MFTCLKSLERNCSDMTNKIDFLANNLLIKKEIEIKSYYVNHIYNILSIIFIRTFNLNLELHSFDLGRKISIDKENLLKLRKKLILNMNEKELIKLCRIRCFNIIDNLYMFRNKIENIEYGLSIFLKTNRNTKEIVIRKMFFLDLYEKKIKKINVLLDRKFVFKKINI